MKSKQYMQITSQLSYVNSWKQRLRSVLFIDLFTERVIETLVTKEAEVKD